MLDEVSSVFSSPKDASAASLMTDVENSGSEKDYKGLNMPLAEEAINGHVKKRQHRSKNLENLLEEANRYTPRYESSLPHGFLRDRRQKSHASQELQLDTTEARKIVAQGKTPKVLKQRKRRPQANKIETNVQVVSNLTVQRSSQINRQKKRVSKVEQTAKQHGKTDISKARRLYFIEPNNHLLELQYDLFDLELLRAVDTFEGSPIPSTVLTSKSSQKNNKSCTVFLKSLLFSNYEEEYHIDFASGNVKYNPMSEIGKIIEYAANIYAPKSASETIKNQILPELSDAFDTCNCDLFAEKVLEYNEVIKNISRKELIEHISKVRKIPISFFHDLLHIVYTRSILPGVRKLKEYEAFSNYVYGELLPSFLSEVYSKCELKPDQIFMDLGSGVGNCVVQAALEYGCKLSFGCEIMPNASQLTENQYKELKERCRLFGLKLNPVEFSLRTSFVDNDRVKALIPQCDVLLINNFLFDSQLNQKVEEIIKNAKIGTKIISLKNLRGQGYTINFFNLESILNRLRVQKFDLKEDSVSWTHTGGEYYISTVLPDVDETLFDPTERKRNTKRPERYTR